MGNILGEQLTKIREKKFPGESLRRVGGTLHEKHGFGEYFYTQLSKMEQGAIVPSIDMLNKILNAYGATKVEKDLMMQAWFEATAMEMATKGLSLKESEVKEAVNLLYRKINKKQK